MLVNIAFSVRVEVPLAAALAAHIRLLLAKHIYLIFIFTRSKGVYHAVATYRPADVKCSSKCGWTALSPCVLYASAQHAHRGMHCRPKFFVVLKLDSRTSSCCQLAPSTTPCSKPLCYRYHHLLPAEYCPLDRGCKAWCSWTSRSAGSETQQAACCARRSMQSERLPVPVSEQALLVRSVSCASRGGQLEVGIHQTRDLQDASRHDRDGCCHIQARRSLHALRTISVGTWMFHAATKGH